MSLMSQSPDLSHVASLGRLGKVTSGLVHSPSFRGSITTRKKGRKETGISHLLPYPLFFALSDRHTGIEECFCKGSSSTGGVMRGY